MHLLGKDSIHLFLWKNQTHENQRSQVSSQAGDVYSRVAGWAPACPSLQAREYGLEFSFFFQGHGYCLIGIGELAS